MAQPVKLHDVAVAAGVSIATASRALAGKTRVAQETRAHVLEVADRLGYQVNPIARALRDGSTRTVGMIVPVIANPFFAELIDAIEAELHSVGLELLLADSHGEVVQERKRLGNLVSRQVDGIFIVPHHERHSVPGIRAALAAVPLLQIDRRVARVRTDFVGVNNEDGIRSIVEHLVEIGTRSIVFASADDQNVAGRGRRTAFEAVTAELDLVVHPHIIGNFSLEAGQEAARQLLARSALPDAVVAGSDFNAFGLISSLRAGGVRVPEDIRVTGFDGTTLSQVFDPPLTTVRQPTAEIAATAVSFLMNRMADPEAPVREQVISPALVVRESTLRERPLASTSIAAGR